MTMAAETSMHRPGRLAMTGKRPSEAVNDACHRIEPIKHRQRCGTSELGYATGEASIQNCTANGIIDVTSRYSALSAEVHSPTARAVSTARTISTGNNSTVAGGRIPKDKVSAIITMSPMPKSTKRGAHRRQREHQPRKIDLGNDVLVVHHDIGAAAERAGKIGPGNQRGEIEDRIRQPLRGQLSQPAEENCEDAHGHERLNNYPEDADEGLLVAYLDVAPDEEIKNSR